MKYRQEYEAEWFTPKRRGWRMACCDCGLVHVVNFRINQRGQIQMQASRHPRATAARRRRKGMAMVKSAKAAREVAPPTPGRPRAILSEMGIEEYT